MSEQERENDAPGVGDNLAHEEGDYIPDPQSPRVRFQPEASGDEEVIEEGSENPQEFGPRIKFGEEQQ